MTTRIIALWIVLAAILGFAFGGTLVWSTQKAPPNNREYPAKAEAQDSRARKTPINSITDEKHNGGKQKENWYQTFLDHTPDWFVAIFTLLLAFITYRLVASTNRLWEAGERQLKIAGKTASVAINVERPYVYVSEIELRRVPLPEGEGPPADVYVPVFTFTNYGRTPAFVTRVGYNHAVVDKLPDEPAYHFTDDLTVELVIRPGESYPFMLEQPWMFIGAEQRAKIMVGKMYPRCWGQIRYRDFLGGVGETGFVAFQYPELKAGDRIVSEAAFRFTGPPAYTYQRYSDDGSDPS